MMVNVVTVATDVATVVIVMNDLDSVSVLVLGLNGSKLVIDSAILKNAKT